APPASWRRLETSQGAGEVAMPASAAIYGCRGMQLAPEEREFFRDAQPFGFILFARNCETPGQIVALCNAMREAIGVSDAPILIDPEGGRAARLKPPHWRARPPARRLGPVPATKPDAGREATYLGARLIANALRAL